MFQREMVHCGRKAVAAVAAAAAMLMLDAGAAVARAPDSGMGARPVRWSPVPRPSSPAPTSEWAAAVIITGPSSFGVTVTGTLIASAISAGAAVDALGDPMDLSRFNRMQRAGAGLAVTGQRPRGMPLSRGYMTSGFGVRLDPVLGGRRLHRGIDMAAPVGTPVIAPGAGTVRLANWNGGYGLFVEIDHGGGLQSRYGHMSRLNVFPGQKLRGGEVIGFVGSTGRSTGPHLHYEMIEGGRAVDPLH